MDTRVLLFGPPAITAGVGSITVSTPDTPSCGQLIPAIAQQFPLLRRYAESGRLAVNGRYGDATTPIRPGDEVAMICMVSGG